MTDKLRYENPPLIEAVAAFNFEPEGWDWTHPGLFHPNHKDAYPIVEQSLIAMPVALPNQQKQFPQHMSFLSSNKKSLIRLAPQQLSVHELAPYSGWENFSTLLRAALKTYAAIAPNRRCSAVSLRYINIFKLTENIVDLRFGEDILLPCIPPNSHEDRQLVGFHTNFVIEGHEAETYIQTNFVHNIGNLIVHNQPIDNKTFLLDLNISWSPQAERRLTVEQLTTEAISDKFENLHAELERYFIACFSERVHTEWFGRIKE